jgi:hypothetical protein
MTLELPRTFVTWSRLAEGRWQVAVDDAPLGRIEQHGERYVALDRRGRPIGVNGTLDAALDRFEELATTTPSVGRGEALAMLARHPVATMRARAHPPA